MVSHIGYRVEAMQQEVSQWYNPVEMGMSRMILARRPQE